MKTKQNEKMLTYKILRPILGPIFKWYYHPTIIGKENIPKEGPILKKDPHATEEALKVLNNGWALGLFPEGTRNKTKEFLLPFKFGAVSMAKKTNATIVPFGITGDYKFRSKNLTIRFGKPYKIKQDLETENKKLESIVGSLMKENLKNSGK